MWAASVRITSDMRKASLATVLFAASTLATPIAARAQEASPEEWHGEVAIYAWLPAMTGDAVVRGNPVDVDMSFGDSIDALSELELALMGHLEVGKGRWTAIGDGLYLSFEEDVGLPRLGRDAKGELSLYLAELGAAYEVNSRNGRAVDVLGGARFIGSEVKFEIEDTAFSRENSRDRVQPFLGARGRWRLGEKWSTALRGDVGGFTSDDMSWNVVASFGYHWKKNRSFNFGYRVLSIDFEDGSGDDAYAYDVIQHGPWMGLGFGF